MALRGIKVIELSGLAPAPFCGMILADFGASVIRIDKVEIKTLDFDCLSNGKSSLALNLKDSRGKGIFLRLCRNSDVLIEPFRKGVMESLGLGPSVLLEQNPRLIYSRLTGYGQDGAMSLKAGHDINFLSLSGLLSLFGRSGDKPLFPTNYAADFAGGGLMCALGIIAALFERHTSGLGQVIDCSMVEGTAYVGSWLYRSQHLPIWGKSRGENILDSGAHFYEVYETKDKKYMAVGAIEPKFYLQLLEGLNLSPDEVPQFGDFKKGKDIFAKKFKEKSQEEWCNIFENLDACVTPGLSLSEAPTYKHNAERKTFLKNNENGNYVPQPTPKLSRTPSETHGTRNCPDNGQNTEEILKELNYSKDEIENFERENIIRIARSKL